MIRRESRCSVLYANTCATHTCRYSIIAQIFTNVYVTMNFKQCLRSYNMIIETILDLSRLEIYTFHLLCLFVRSPLRF